MTRSAQSVFYFGIYVTLMGILLVLIPNWLLALAKIPNTNEVWIRIAGMLIFFLGSFYIQAGRHNLVPLFKWSLVTRASATIFMTGFVLSRLISPVIFLFWFGDLIGALWTFFALRLEGEI